MKSAYITVVGSLPIRFDLEQAQKIGPVIASSNSNKSINFEYATVNSEVNLQDMLNSPNFNDTKLLVPEQLFKKYVFFDPVTCLPEFPGLVSYDIDPTKCSPQTLSIMLAVYNKPKIVRIYQPYQVNNHEWYVPFIMHMDRVMVGEKTHYGYKEIKTERGLVTDEIVYFNASVWENPLLEIV